MPARSDLYKAWAGLALTSLFWGGNALVARAVHESIPPLALSFWRWTFCALLLTPWILRAFTRHRAIIRHHLPQLLVLAMSSVTAFNSLLYLAAQHTTAINITLVNTLMPLATLLFAVLLLGHRLTPRQLLALLIGMCGVLVVVSQGHPKNLVRLSLNPGDLIMALGMLSWSLYSVLLKRWPVGLPQMEFLAVLVAIGLPMIAPFYLWELTRTGPFEWSGPHLLALGYVAVFPSLLAYVFWNYGVSVAGPGTAALFSYLTPLLAAALAIPLLGEDLLPAHVLGAGLLFAGLWLARSPRRDDSGRR